MSNSLQTANARAWNLALSLMVTVIVFEAENGLFGVMPSSDYDGDASAIMLEFDPFV
jgi:hypothetical protein